MWKFLNNTPDIYHFIICHKYLYNRIVRFSCVTFCPLPRKLMIATNSYWIFSLKTTIQKNVAVFQVPITFRKNMPWYIDPAGLPFKISSATVVLTTFRKSDSVLLCDLQRKPKTNWFSAADFAHLLRLLHQFLAIVPQRSLHHHTNKQDTPIRHLEISRNAIRNTAFTFDPPNHYRTVKKKYSK